LVEAYFEGEEGEEEEIDNVAGDCPAEVFSLNQLPPAGFV
jgi:hypothetical protein